MKIMMKTYRVFLLNKHSPDTATIHVQAEDEEDAMDEAEEIIDLDDNYVHFRTGWKISEAEEI